MKILLVAPRNALLNQFNYPLGLSYVAAALKKAGADVICHNNAIIPDHENALADILRSEKPDIVGCGGLTPSFGHIRRIFEITREILPQATTVVGGAVLSSEPAVFTSLGADVGVLGEGEATVVELVAALESEASLDGIPGLMLRGDDGQVLRTPPRVLIADLDSIALPDYGSFDLTKCQAGTGTVDIIASRGCPFNCTFCYSVMGRGRYRVRSLDNLFEEIDLLVHGHGMRLIGLMDDLFTLKPERVQEFCKRIKPYGIQWYTQVRVDSIDADTLKLMKDAGCVVVFYGLESMNEDVLRSMNKKITPAQIERTLELTHSSGINQFGNFIFGDPAETPGTMRSTLRWWLASKKHFINIGKIDCWPGTRIYHQAIEKGLIKDKIRFIEEGCPTLNLTSMPEEQFRSMLKLVSDLHRTMTYPAKVVGAARDGASWSLRLRCPHCGRSQTIHEADQLPDQADRSAPRADCVHCGLQFDIPVTLPPRSFTEEGLRKFDSALEAWNVGDTPLAATLLRELLQEPEPHPAACYALGLLRLATGKPEMGLVAARIGLLANPCEHRLHQLYGMLLKSTGDYELSLAHVEQGHILREARREFLASRPAREAYRENPLWDESLLPDPLAVPGGPVWTWNRPKRGKRSRDAT